MKKSNCKIKALLTSFIIWIICVSFAHPVSLPYDNPFTNVRPKSSINDPSSSTFTINIGTTQTFVMNVSDADCNLKGTEWYVSGTYIGGISSLSGCSTTTSRSYTFNTAGTFTMTGLVKDALGLYCDATHRAKWTITVNDPVNPPNGYCYNPNNDTIELYQKYSQTFIAKGTDIDNDLDGCDWYVNGSSYTSDNGISGGLDYDTISYQFNNSGWHTVTDQFYDNEGHYSNTSLGGKWRVNVLTHTPTTSQISPLNDTLTINKGDTLEFIAQANDAAGDLNCCTWYVNGTSHEVNCSMDGAQDNDTISIIFNTVDTTTIQAQFNDDKDFYSNGGVGARWIVVVEANKPDSEISFPGTQNVDIYTGESIEFILSASHIDGDLDGCDWYVNGDLESQDPTLSGYSETATMSYIFNSPGTYSITGQVYTTGNDYSLPDNSAHWDVTVKSSIRGMYVDKFYMFLGDTIAEAKILNYAKNHKINSLSLYALYKKDNEIFEDTARESQLASFIQMARDDYDIINVGAVVSTVNMVIMAYNYNENHQDAAFDALTTEGEYWSLTELKKDHPNPTKAQKDSVRAIYYPIFITLLDTLNYFAGIQGFMVDSYVGWPDSDFYGTNEYDEITAKNDRIFLHSYKDDPDVLYSTIEDRIYEFANSANSLGKELEIWPLFSAEFDDYRGLNGYRDYLGPWLRDYADSLSDAEEIFFDDYYSASHDLNPDIFIEGCQWFDYTHMFVALEELPESTLILPSANDSINVGDTLTFTMLGTDSDGNLRGSEWYVGGIFKDSVGNLTGYSDTATFTHIFTTAGDFTVLGLVRDTYWDYCDVNNRATWEIHVANSEPIAPGGKIKTDILPAISIPQNKIESRMWFENPITNVASIRYSLEREGHVKLHIVNQNGQVEKILIDGYRKPEQNIIRWSPKGRSSGLYYIIFSVDGKVISAKKAIYYE